LGYGPPWFSLETFLGSIGSSTSPRTARHQVSGIMSRGFAYDSPYTLTPGQPTPGLDYLPASSHRLTTTSVGPASPPLHHKGFVSFRPLATLDSAWANQSGYGNINPLSIDYACRPRLRSRLTLGGLACPRNPWSSGGGVSHSSFATHACILTRVASTTGLPRRFTGHTTLPYPSTHLALRRVVV
jgi:hypothetical protein